MKMNSVGKMQYSTFWKSTWYKCDDYGALCRCLAQLGADSFSCVHADVRYISDLQLVTDPSVVIYEYED